MGTPPSKAPDFSRFAARNRPAVKLSESSLVKTGSLDSLEGFPLVIQPGAGPVDLASWAAHNREMIEAELLKHGGILFRGFGVDTVEEFRAFSTALTPQQMGYGERSSPRHAVGEGVFTSTDHPAHQPILLHNEQSYTLSWPMKIIFCCIQPAQERGRTPIADSRKILRRLPAEVTGKFQDRGVLYVRNYGEGLGLPWPEVFQTRDPAEVEAYCREMEIEVEWRDGKHLRTRQWRPAIRRHPKSGEPIWFNHALFFHVSSLDPSVRDPLLAVMRDEDLPFNTYYGDGSPIEPEVLETLRAAYDAETVSFDWEKGDVLLLDNMLSAHGREPFVGPRKIVVAMADPYVTVAS